MDVPEVGRLLDLSGRVAIVTGAGAAWGREWPAASPKQGPR